MLDLACGKGGDLKKYWNFPELRRYTGMDIAHSSLCDLVQRFNSQQGARGHAPVQARLVCADLGVANLSEHKVLEDGEKFDIVSIQFALHYMFDTRVRASMPRASPACCCSNCAWVHCCVAISPGTCDAVL